MMNHCETDQMNTWGGDFGREYTERSPQTPDQLNEHYLNLFGHDRESMNMEFLGNLNRDIRILEVGSNVGVQLQLLQRMGFRNLYGVELQQYAVELSKNLTQGINIIQGSGFDIPYRDEWFDLVYTSGVLIHISPDDLPLIMGEIYRCSASWIWGYEYYAPSLQEIPYRGNQNLMWKGNYADVYIDRYPGLSCVKERKYKYLEDENVDQMFLLEKARTS